MPARSQPFGPNHDRNEQIRALAKAAKHRAGELRIEARLAVGRMVTLRSQSRHQLAKRREHDPDDPEQVE